MYPVAILGATGVVGQKAIALLNNHPEFYVAEVVASDHRVGQRFGDSCDWREVMPLPAATANLELISMENIQSSFVISGLPSHVALKDEPRLLERGKIISSNASTFRMEPHVPLMVPEVNGHHLSLLQSQKTLGKIICNPNCSVGGLVPAVAPLMSLGGGLEHLSIVTLQSVSGAGYPGVSSFDILNNTIPHIPQEADKISEEVRKILGSSECPAALSVTTHVHRVPVLFGHTATLHMIFANDVSVDEVMGQYGIMQKKYPSLLKIHSEEGFPQPNRSLTPDDMRVHIGHIRQGGRPNVIGLVVLSHNLVRGAAGAAIANLSHYVAHESQSLGTQSLGTQSLVTQGGAI